VVRGKKALLAGLAIVLALTVVGMAACGGSDDGTKVDPKAAVVTAQPKWQAIVDACAGVGADAAKAQQIWDALTAAINGLADDAGMVQMAAVAGPGIAVQTFLTELRQKVGPSAGGAATTSPSS
jgi:hypothetical protein